jgi:UDP-N-acetylmuramyl pentapeptide phosphotransferase/UDP-N-acetylglucosamine-1-phosphate transferase
MLQAAPVAVSTANRWLAAGILAMAVVLALAASARSQSRRNQVPDPATGQPARRGTRRRAGALIALGPLVGLVFASDVSGLTVLVALGAIALALVGAGLERSPRAETGALVAAAVAAAIAVIAGARLEPTGVPALDVIGAFVFVFVVMKSIDGLGNADGLAPGMGVLAGGALFGIAAFGHQDGLASVLIGFTGACFAFLAFNVRPASLFVGRGGRLGIGFTLAVGALAVDPVAVPWRELTTPLVLLAIFLLDGVMVTVARLRRRRAVFEHRNDHVLHRLVALGWSTNEAVAFLLLAQFFLSAIALFTARGILPLWLTAVATVVVLLFVGIEAGRARLERAEPRGLPGWAWIVVLLLVVWMVAATAPLALAANDTVDLMQRGREEATRALNAARDGDTITARGSFQQAAQSFSEASDKLGGPLASTGLAIPFYASNVRAARTLADIGTDLANAGSSLTAAVNPDALEVVDGRLPVEEVRKITPELEQGAAALANARARLDELRSDPYLVSQVQEAVDKVYGQLVRADREAQHASDAAKLAPAIFGADGDRTYLLVTQNNAESRATGGFIGSYALITAHDGKLDVGDIIRTNTWNEAVRASGDLSYDAPTDYKKRYAQYRPDTTLQNVNLSPDFPSVAKVLMSLAPHAGLPKIDGVLSVDPAGLAALLQLTGPVDVADWPTPIDSNNVVNVTLRDAYAQFAETPERADFLGDVAKATVDKATSDTLGKPAEIAKVLGKAAHEGHLDLAFARPEEQALARQLGISGRLDPVRSDGIAVTTSNFAGNKIDYYLQRAVDYRVMVKPNDTRTRAKARATLTTTLDNTAPAEGLPQIVIGPFLPDRFVAGENRTLLSVYSPLDFVKASVDGKEAAVAPSRERGRNVYSLIERVPSKTQKTTAVELEGDVKLHEDWYTVQVRNQPTLNADRVHVSVDVPEGWRIDRAPGMELVFARRADVNVSPDTTMTYRVHIVPDAGAQNLWERLVNGS